MCSMTHLCPIDAVVTQDNNLGRPGAKALRPALEKLENLAGLWLRGTCVDVRRRSTQCDQCVRVRGAGQAVVVICDRSFAREVFGVWSVR